MNSRTFNNIDESLVQEVKSKLANFGIKLEGDRGSISHMGVSADYEYRAAEKTLSLNNVKVGMPASFAGYTSDKIFKQIEDAINKR